MRKAAEEASLSLGNLQYYFKTKEILLTGLLDFYLKNYEKELEDLKSELPPEEREKGKRALRRIIRRILEDEAVGEADEIEMIFLSLGDLDNVPSNLPDPFYRCLYDLIYSLLEWICPGAKSKRIHRGASLLFPYIISYHE